MTELMLIAARTVHFAATASLGGTLAFWCLIARPAFRRAACRPAAELRLRRQLVGLAAGSLALAVASGIPWLLAIASEMSGEPLRAAVSHGVVGTVLTRTRFGQDWLLRLGLAVMLAGALCGLARGRRDAWGAIGLTLAAGLLATLAWAGHGGATPGMFGGLHLAADILHLLAAGAWLGALVPLALLLPAAQPQSDAAMLAVARAAALRFSILGVVCVAILLATGVVNTWFLVGGLPALTGTLYGRLLLVKIALFAAMVAIAAVNRLRLTPRLEGRPGPTAQDAAAQLRRNALIEAGFGLLVLGVVGALGTLAPGTHAGAGHHPMGTMSSR